MTYDARSYSFTPSLSADPGNREMKKREEAGGEREEPEREGEKRKCYKQREGKRQRESMAEKERESGSAILKEKKQPN